MTKSNIDIIVGFSRSNWCLISLYRYLFYFYFVGQIPNPCYLKSRYKRKKNMLILISYLFVKFISQLTEYALEET